MNGGYHMYDTVVIGAGQAGLAVGYYLKQANQHFLILDKKEEVGATWKERYDSLVLFTPRMYNCLPGLSFNGDEHGFPTRNEVVDYLKRYAETFNLPIRLNEEVWSVTKEHDCFEIQTKNGKYQAKNVVVATGPFQTPYIPSFSKNISKSVFQLHSSQYKNPEQLMEGNVLVVGGGNSGAQIAVELSQYKATYLAVSKKPAFLPLVLGKKSIFWWFDKFGLLKANHQSFVGKVMQRKGDPIFGYELKQAIRDHKIILKRKVVGVVKDQLVFEDLSSLEVKNIIWATGFTREYPWLQIDGVFNEDSKEIHNRGVTNIEGLYFIGLPWQYRRGSSLLQGVGKDAEYIVSKIEMNGRKVASEAG
jgi:putative flavoprotein involved in K+ transport